MKFLLVLTALTVAVNGAVPRRLRISPLEARRMVTTNFENGTMNPWYDTSPGDVKWVIEDEANPMENYPVPPMTSGTKYLRAKRTYTGSFGTAVLRSVEWLALPGDNITLSFWIRSKVAAANSLDVYWLNGTTEVRLMSLTQFSSPSNLEWRTRSAALPITSSMTTSLIIYGMCGANQEDAIAIDNISLVGVSDTTTTVPTTTVSTTASTTAVTHSTTQSTATTTETASTTEAMTTETSTEPATTEPASTTEALTTETSTEPATTEPASTTEALTTETATEPAITTEILETTTNDVTTEDVTTPEVVETTKTDEPSTLQPTTITEELVTSDPPETTTESTEAPEVTTPTTTETSVTEETTTTPTTTTPTTTTPTTTTPTTSTPASTTTTPPPIGGCPSYLASNTLPCYRLGSICYCFSTYTDTWYNAESTCRKYTEYGMKLVSIQTGAEQDLIVSHIKVTSPLANATQYWTSGSDFDLEGDWKWTSTGGSVSSGFVNWARYQPDNSEGNENCMRLDTSVSQWFDDTCWTTKSFICEGNQ